MSSTATATRGSSAQSPAQPVRLISKGILRARASFFSAKKVSWAPAAMPQVESPTLIQFLPVLELVSSLILLKSSCVTGFIAFALLLVSLSRAFRRIFGHDIGYLLRGHPSIHFLSDRQHRREPAAAQTAHHLHMELFVRSRFAGVYAQLFF